MFLTIYTPTFNRCDLLKRCYKSLCDEKFKDFEWIIIDDGSNDNTQSEVEKWIKEKKLDIKYVYKKNQGVHSARNLACELANGELCMCIDSDDYIVKGAIQKIYEFYHRNNKDNIVGIIALNTSENDEVIGDDLPNNIHMSTLYNLYKNIGIKGDKKLIYKTKIIKKYKYPLYEGEKRIPPSYVYYQIDKEGKLLLFNEKVCVVDYQKDGISNTSKQQRFSSPQGMLDYYELMNDLSISFKEKYFNSIRIQTYKRILGKSWRNIIFNKVSLINIFAIPGCMFLLWKNRKELK